MSKVSIIMPVYNAERYLREAIDSVLRQTYTDFELLLINDRSSDESAAICREYGERDSRIVLLENDTGIHGPGPTRNIGLDHASGEYIYFMDADDWIEDHLLECAVARMEETSADIAQFGAALEMSDGKQFEQTYWTEQNELTKDDITQNFFCYWKNKSYYLWVHLFRYRTVEHIRFENIMCSEDSCYVMDALSKAENIALIAQSFYHYRIIAGSTCHRWDPNIMECLLVEWNHTKCFLDSFPSKLDPLDYSKAAYDHYLLAIYNLSVPYCPLSLKEKRNELKKFCGEMGFEASRDIYPLKMERGLMKLKYALVKFHLEWLILWLGPLYLRILWGRAMWNRKSIA